MTSLCCTSRQARTHRPQLMQASRLTAIEECVLSARAVRPGITAGSAIPMSSTQFQNDDAGIVTVFAGWLVCKQQLEHHLAGFLRALTGRFHLHAVGGLALARSRQAHARLRPQPCTPGSCHPRGTRFGNQHRCGIVTPSRLATCQIVSPALPRLSGHRVRT
jgi:hypothetical protein